ncbi:MAG: hypothetical protein RIQ93_1366 [Verrucomicrobiota bacterium]|jgi:hypothetical protein
MLVAAVMAFVLGAKLGMIENYGSELPYWDQWDAEGNNLYRPYLQGELTFADLLQPHNEHRTFFTRVFGLGIFEANDRQWNARVQVVANAVLHTSVAVLLLAFALHALPLAAAAACGGVIALFFGMNVSWENTLSGFQSQFYFLLLFSLLHLAGTLLARPRSKAWWLAPIAGLAALFSMASGLLSAVAIISVTVLRGLRDRKFTRDDGYVLATNCALTATGWLLKTEVPGHAELKAHSLGGWLNSWLHQLAWPVSVAGIPWPAVLGLIPPLAILWHYLRRSVTGPVALTLLAAAAWQVLQTMAIAYARGSSFDGYTSRYTDTLAMGVVINILTLACLATQSASPMLRQRWKAAAVVWGAFCLSGLWVQSSATESNTLSALPAINTARIATVRAYVVDRDPAFFTKTAWNELPYPDAPRLARILNEPAIRSILPASVTPPIPLAPDPRSSGFTPYRETAVPGPAPGRSAWIAAGPGPALFRSEAFITPHARVTLFVSAGSRASGRIRLLSETGRAFEPLGDFRTSVPRWKRVNFLAPPGAYHLEVNNEGPDWLAFTQPGTDTPLAHAASTLIAMGAWFHGGGVLLGLAAGLLLLPRITGGKSRGPGRTDHPAGETHPRPSTDSSPRHALQRFLPPWAEPRKLPRLSPDRPGVAATICACFVLLTLFGRRPEMFLQPQLWAEDGPIFLLQADTWSGTLTSPYGGYHLLLPRLVAAVSSGLDIHWIPTAYFIASIVTILAIGFALYSPRIELPHRAACFLAIALLPHSGEVFGNLTNLQWLTALGLVWLLLARDATSPRQHASDGIVAVACGLTGIYSILFSPLFFWRAWQRRTRASLFLMLLIATGAAIQISALTQASDAAAVEGQLSVDSVLAFIGLRLVAALTLPAAWAERLPPSVHLALGIAALLLLGWAACRSGPQRELRRMLAGCAVFLLAATLYRARADLSAFNSLSNGDRYLFLPKLFVAWLLISGWSGAHWVRPATYFACGLALIATISGWRYLRLVDYHWPEYAKRIQAGEAVYDIPVNPPGMAFDHPGRH